MNGNRSPQEPRGWQFTLREVLCAVGFACLALGIARHHVATDSLAHFLMTTMLFVAAIASSGALITGLPFLTLATLLGAIPKPERREWWLIATMTAIYAVTFWLVLFWTWVPRQQPDGT